MRQVGASAQLVHGDVQRLVGTVFGLDPGLVLSEAELVNDLGASSLESLELVMSVEDNFDIAISDHEAAAVITVRDLENLIETRFATAGKH